QNFGEYDNVLCTEFWQHLAAKLVPEFSPSRVTWMNSRGERPHGERRPRTGSPSHLHGAAVPCPRHPARIAERSSPRGGEACKIPGGRPGCQREGAKRPWEPPTADAPGARAADPGLASECLVKAPHSWCQ